MFISTSLFVLLHLTAATTIEADIVLSGAEIHNGTGEPPIVGDVALLGSRIVAVGKFDTPTGARVIDARNLVVAPGFIDLHNHSDAPITREPTRLNQNFLAQGVTTIVTGNCGGGRVDVERYLAQVDEQGAGTNVAHLIPHGEVRRAVLGEANRTPSPAELVEMQSLVEQGMTAGAWGMSTGLIYVPSMYADTAELIELSKVVARHGGIYVSHIRNENTRLLEAIDELLTIGQQAGVAVHLSHFKASGRDAWGLAREAIRKVEQARAAGQTVTADQYPYIASSTSLGAMVVPDDLRTTSKFIAALQDPDRGAKLRTRLEQAIASRSGGATLFVASYAKNREWQGRDLASLSRDLGRSVVDLVIEIQSHGGAAMVNFGMQDEEVRAIMQQPYVATASDGGAKVPDDTVPHPRSYGTFPRKIGHYAITEKTLSLAHAIRSSSGLPADILGMRDRGYVKSDYIADLVVFDPTTFRETATYEQPHQYALGVRYLIVGGEFAIDDGEVTGKLVGRALRRPPNSVP